MKVRTLVVAAVMFLALSAAAFAQGTFNVGSTPVTAVINTGITENTGDITLNVASIQGGGTVAGTVSIYYSGVPITNNALAAANVVGSGGLAGVNINVNTSLPLGNLVLNVPAGGAVGDVIRVTGIKVAVANTGLTSLNAQLSSVGNAITAGQTVVQVVSSIVNGIVVEGTNVTVNAVTGAATGAPSISVTEGFLNAFGAVDATLTPGSLGFVITVSPIPAGMTLTFPATPAVTAAGPTTAVFEATDADGVVLGADVVLDETSTDLQVYYRLTADSDPFQIETVDIAIVPDPGTAKYVGAVPVTAMVSLYPIGTVTTPAAKPIPRYAELETEVLLVDFTGSNTWICVPFAQVQPDISYDTGLGIANTTLDPGGFATPQPGTIDFFFYPNDASAPFSYSTTAGSPGAGLDATGKVPAGKTYSVLVSQLMAAARATNAAIPESFSGYLFVQCNFTNAHGIYTVSNFSTFSQGGQLLVTDRNGPPAEWWNN